MRERENKDRALVREREREDTGHRKTGREGQSKKRAPERGRGGEMNRKQ